MSFNRYISWCSSLIEELEESMTDEDIQLLREDIKANFQIGNDWFRWAGNHRKDIWSFAGSTPAARLKRAAWRNGQHRRRLVLASVRHIKCAYILLESIDSHSLEEGASYRGMAVAAGEAYSEICYDKAPPYWLFDHPNPFPWDV